jgi:hypothetical protein
MRTPGDGKVGNIMVRTTVAAVVGGTASELGGGKFANGAMTAAVQHLFNGEGAQGRKLDGGLYARPTDAAGEFGQHTALVIYPSDPDAVAALLMEHGFGPND